MSLDWGNSWLEHYIRSWSATVEHYQVELDELMQPKIRVGINTVSPQRASDLAGVMRLEPLSSPPEEARIGDIYMHESGALCVYINSWEIVTGDGYCPESRGVLSRSSSGRTNR